MVLLAQAIQSEAGGCLVVGMWMVMLLDFGGDLSWAQNLVIRYSGTLLVIDSGWELWNFLLTDCGSSVSVAFRFIFKCLDSVSFQLYSCNLCTHMGLTTGTGYPSHARIN